MIFLIYRQIYKTKLLVSILSIVKKQLTKDYFVPKVFNITAITLWSL